MSAAEMIGLAILIAYSLAMGFIVARTIEYANEAHKNTEEIRRMNARVVPCKGCGILIGVDLARRMGGNCWDCDDRAIADRP